MVSEKEIKHFLDMAKKLINEGRRDFIPRTYEHPSGRIIKWPEAFSEVNLRKIDQVWPEMMKLSTEHYKSGPDIDRNRPADGKCVWVFHKTVNGVLTYIKLKIDGRGCVCISFHKVWFR